MPAQPSEASGSRGYLAGICLVATLGGLLFGYDTAVISGAIGFLKTRFALDAAGEGWAASCALLGCVIGVSLAGEVSDRLGRRKALILAAVLFLVSSIGTALPRTLAKFIVFRIIGGVGIGVASMASPMYIAEVSPAAIRGRMVSINQFAIVSGMLMVYFVNYAIARQGDEAWNVTQGWRWMFASGAIPSLALLALLWLVPCTPRYLLQRGQREEARRILERIGGPAHADAEVRAIESALSQESGSLAQLFQPGMRGVLVMGVALAVLQQVTGINVFLYYAPEIFKKLGSGTDSALLQTVVVGAVNMAFTVVAIWTVDILGRKPLMLLGFFGMGLSLFSLGHASYVQRIEAWALLFILGYIASFALAVGPVTWVILSEIFPNRIRGRALALCTFCLWLANWVVSQTFPMMNENPGLIQRFHHAFPFWVYAALCVVSMVFVAVWVPETKGKSLEEIERMWETKP